jgi:hypothetical protein
MGYFRHFRWQKIISRTNRNGEVHCIFGRVGTRDGYAMYDGVVMLSNKNGAQLLINEPFYVNGDERLVTHHPTEADEQTVMRAFWEEVVWDTWG